jgi:hypothetical protein
MYVSMALNKILHRSLENSLRESLCIIQYVEYITYDISVQNVKIKTYKTLILPVVLYLCET